MRLSCNGCRVLRKGCSSDCPIRPCLQWIKSPQSQANATLFLAKFYGRAGLINLITAAAAPHLRPAAFKSLLEEACGRIVNPIFGCTGLLSSGRWDLCEAAVEAVLNGAPIKQASSSPSGSESESECMLKARCDIRHVGNKGKESSSCLLKVKSRRNQFKRSGTGKNRAGIMELLEECGSGSGSGSGSGLSEHTSFVNSIGGEGDDDDRCSVETVEAEALQQPQTEPGCNGGDVDLNLTLGLGPYNPSTLNNDSRLGLNTFI